MSFHSVLDEPAFTDGPVEVFKKRIHILFLVGWNVVHHECMLPHIDGEDDREAGELPELVVAHV